MKQKNTVVTLALLGVLALAAHSRGGLLTPSGNVVHAADPECSTATTDAHGRSVPENTPPGVNIGAPISATDDDEGTIEYGQTLTYSLGGTDAASFDIDSSTGQLITKAPLDTETKANYTVIVTADDGETRDPAITETVTITVSPVDEKPGALAAPTVVATDSVSDAATYELKVIWYAPDDGGDGVTGYDVEYKKTTAASFGSTNVDHSGTNTTANITGLEVDTSYQVRVRAKKGDNAVDLGPWSLSSAGSTNKKDNDLPTFADATVTLNVLENAESGLVVGAPVSATDDDNVLPLAYRLHGPDAGSFDLQASTGQIRTKRGVVYDFETKLALRVTMTVSDGQGGSDATAVTINVTDVFEAPSKPDRPTVRATQGNSRSLDVSWRAPNNTGPAITSYDLRYRKGSSGNFRLQASAGTGTTATIAPEDDGNTNDVDERLTPGSSYEVYVRAKSPEKTGGGEWSAAGTGRTSEGNKEPKFSDRSRLDDPNPITPRTVAENTRAGQSVGRAVGASDGNGDKRTYKLAAADSPNQAHVNKFDINESTGQILTKDPLNHEADCSDADTGGDADNCTYTVKVEVWDGLDEDRNKEEAPVTVDDTITVNITVSDVAEKPAAPAVTVTSLVVADGATEATLTVTWDRPENTGPALTGYVVECTGDGFTATNPCPQPEATDIADLTDSVQTYEITGLTPNKPYRVRVRADNAEGQGAWSSWATQFTSKDGNELPTFDATPDDLYVAENASSTRQPLTTDNAGQTVAALQGSDGDGDTLTLRLEGPGAGRFDIDNGTGQIKTRSKLDHEAAECGYDNTQGTTACTYSVRVKLSDPNGGSIFHALTINVTDKDEPPAKPAAPRVTATSGSGWSLEVTWNAPRNDGPPITGYQIRYRKTGDSTLAWQQWPPNETNVTGRSVKITTSDTAPGDTAQVHLEPSTQYEVQVRALNGEGDLEFGTATIWSTSGRGTTGKGNRRPVFKSTDSVVGLNVEENTRSGQNVGSAVEATDADKNGLTYTLEGPGKDSFTITSAGQIRTRSSLNHEERDKYSLTVKVDDRQRKNNSVAAKSVTITVTDRPEAPSAPGAPKVSGIPGSTDSMRVTWDEPANAGPAITHYRLQYAVSGSRDAFTQEDPPTGSADRSAVITGLTAGTRYEVQVRAESPEGHSDWSRSGTGSPNPDQANRAPAFSTRSHTFSVAENTPPGADVGSLVAALDPDGDTLTYTLEGVDADSFDIIATNGAGQIQTKAALNHEEKASYSVAVRVRDGRGGTDAVNVTIRVTDVDNEAPDTPFAPTVAALSSTSLQVSWDAPENTGPPITDYDYRYRAVADTDWTEVTNTTITGTTVTVDGLTASTSYDVEVRAKNAEGASDWSNPGNGATNAPGANNPPVFTDGTSATRSVSASAPTGTSIGLPVTATDADSGDILTYSLEGRDAALFSINETNGQLLTKSGVTLIVGETYTVTVAVDDASDTTTIPVSIEATAAPPNTLPVFSEGASATRSVREDAQAGTSIGGPVRATDADQGDTLTYNLEGTDAASFNIVASSGQIRTRAALDASTKSTYSVTVRATDTQGGSATIAVTITVTARPTTFGCATLGAVSDASNSGLVEDCEALMASRNALEGNTGRLNWSPSRSIDQWDGVYLRGTPERVTFLILRSQGLDGSVPADLGQLDRLTVLNLHSNALTGQIPSEIGNLRNLEQLLLHNNSLSGDFPDLSRLSNLEKLWLSGRNNRIGEGDGIPTWLNGLTRLEEVNLWGNEMGGTIPNLSRLTSLKLLKLQYNSLTGSIPTWLGSMNSLGGLYLHRNNLTGSIPSELGQLTRLRRLWIDRNELTGSIPAALGSMSNLGTLNLHTNRLSGSIPTELGNLSRLQHIGFHNNQLTGTIPSQLGNLDELTRLWVSNNRLTGSIPGALGMLGKLQSLNLHTNQLSGPIPSQLRDLGNTLTRLRLGGTIDDSDIEVRGNTGLTGCVPASLAGATDTTDLRLAGQSGLSICP